MKQRHLLPILLTWFILVALLTLHLRDSTLIPTTLSTGLTHAKGWKSSFLGSNDDSANDATTMENNRMACDYCPHPASPLFSLVDPGSAAFCHAIGEHNLARSIAYEGSSSRIHRLLAKLDSGKAITVGVLGGSVSAGHGLYASGFPAEREGEGNMHWRVFDWVRKRWPVTEGEGHRFVNGAVAGTGTSLSSFALLFCSSALPLSSLSLLSSLSSLLSSLSSLLSSLFSLLPSLCLLERQTRLSSLFSLLPTRTSNHTETSSHTRQTVIQLLRSTLYALDSTTGTPHAIHSVHIPSPSLQTQTSTLNTRLSTLNP
jgi:hypothetical protein